MRNLELVRVATHGWYVAVLRCECMAVDEGRRIDGGEDIGRDRVAL
jgi:hypothetical protein